MSNGQTITLEIAVILLSLTIVGIITIYMYLNDLGFHIPRGSKYRCIHDFDKKLKAAKRAYKKAQRNPLTHDYHSAEYEVFTVLKNMKIDLESTPTIFVRAMNLTDAIHTYLRYDDLRYTHNEILCEVIGAYWYALHSGETNREYKEDEKS